MTSFVKNEKLRLIGNLLRSKFNGAKASDMYLIYWNDYLTIDKMAEDYGVNPVQLEVIINEGRKQFNQKKGRL
jgi:hypothetical protein